MKRPNIIVVVLALLALAASSAYAGKTLFTGADVKNGSITGADIRDHSLTLRDLRIPDSPVAHFEVRTATKVAHISSGGSAVDLVRCPEGFTATGGGVLPYRASVNYDAPEPGGVGWAFSVTDNDGIGPSYAVGYAVCAKV